MKTESQIRLALRGFDLLGRQATLQGERRSVDSVASQMAALEWVLDEKTKGADVVNVGLALAEQLVPDRN